MPPCKSSFPSPWQETGWFRRVVTPNKGIMDHWLSEVAKFAPHLRVCYYDSANAYLSECSVFNLFPPNNFL